MSRYKLALVLLVSGIYSVCVVTDVQAFSFCFSFGSKQRQHYYEYPPDYHVYPGLSGAGMMYYPGMLYPDRGIRYPLPYRPAWTELPVPAQSVHE